VNTKWVVEFEGLNPLEEGRREALCTLGNGVFGTRGAAPESHLSGAHYPGTYAAGVFNRLDTEVAGLRLEHESLVNLPNWLPLTFRVEDGPWLGDDDAAIVGYRQTLDHLQGKTSLEDAIRLAQAATRQYAKRQMTWFRKEPGIHWLSGFGTDPHIQAEAVRYMAEQLRESEVRSQEPE